MSWWEALVLGVVQGLTEFFPVSSSGHLVMAQELLGLTLPGVLFEVAVHVATLFSVLLVYRKRVFELILGCCGLREPSAWPYVLKLALATAPAAIIGLSLEDWFERQFEFPAFAGTMLLVTGCVVWSTRWVRERRRSPLEWLPVGVAAVVAILAGTILPFAAVLAVQVTILVIARATAAPDWTPEPTWGDAFTMGVAQAVAILPGISRSGSTVVAALWRRVDPVAAAEFSFLMSVPAILGAAILKLPDFLRDGQTIGTVPLLTGALAAGLSGILAIWFFVALLRRQSFHAFAYYCWIAGALFLVQLQAG